MRKSKFTEEQIIRALQEVEAGSKVQDIIRKLSVTETTFYRWKAKYGGLDVNERSGFVRSRTRPAAEDPRRRPHSRQAGVAAPSRNKMVRPAALRPAVDELRAKFAMKKRRACRVVGLAPSTLYYRARRPEAVELVAKLRAHAAKRPRWGYRRLHVLLSARGTW